GIECDRLVPRADDCLHGGVDRLGGAESDGDLRLRVEIASVARGELARDALTQLRDAFHRGVLVVSLTHGLAGELGEPRVDVIVWEALPQIECPELAGTTRHDREDGRADVGELARHPLPRRRAPRRARPPDCRNARAEPPPRSAAAAQNPRTAR